MNILQHYFFDVKKLIFISHMEFYIYFFIHYNTIKIQCILYSIRQLLNTFFSLLILFTNLNRLNISISLLLLFYYSWIRRHQVAHLFLEMIDAFLGHVSKVLSGPNDFERANSELLKSLTTGGMLSKIHRIKMNDLNQLHTLYTVLEQYPNVRTYIYIYMNNRKWFSYIIHV